MLLRKINLLGVDVTISGKTEIFKEVSGYLTQKNSSAPLTIFTPNPEQIVLAQKDGVFRNVLNSADIALPDGMGVVWALKALSVKREALRIERIPGIEFMENLVELAAEKGWPVAFIGGRGGVAQMTLTLLKKKYPGLKGWGEEPPALTIKYKISNIKYTYKILNSQDEKQWSNETVKQWDIGLPDAYFNQLVRRIRESEIKLIFVGLGAPKQEYFIESVKHKALSVKYNKPLVLMSVGGVFDILSGRIPRVPKFIRIFNLEWLWRLGLEPWRVKRQLQLLKFLVLVLKDRFVIQSS